MKNLLISIKLTLAFCVLLSVGYIFVLWAFAQAATPSSGRAQTLALQGVTVGASNVGQTFTCDKYFWGRPSAVDYNGAGSGGSNKSVSNPEYLEQVSLRIDAFLVAHPYLNRSQVPSEMVTASGSGLDPHISPQVAMIQVNRVAQAREADPEQIIAIVNRCSDKPLMGTSTINVLKLNIALDEKFNN